MPRRMKSERCGKDRGRSIVDFQDLRSFVEASGKVRYGRPSYVEKGRAGSEPLKFISEIICCCALSAQEWGVGATSRLLALPSKFFSSFGFEGTRLFQTFLR